ncbi:VCBS repeat-containing protein, partial [Streptomyces sp. SID4917]|nr:VCBS repeat-containing protein [Streptomyces sp. SID4917]
RARAPGRAAQGELLLGGPDGPGRPGGTYRFKAVELPPPPTLPGSGAGSSGKGGTGKGKAVTDFLLAADFTGDKRPDPVTRTHRGEATDLIALYGTTGGVTNRPLMTFSTAIFLG